MIFTVVECPDNSANAPRFRQQAVEAQVMENDVVGHMVTIMSATDEDGDKVWYSITGE